MTEELEKEAEEKYSEVDREFMDCQDEGEIFNLGYLASAEPREKRIAELEEKLANVDYQLEGRDIKIKELEAQIEKMKNWCNCKNYQKCLIELAEQGKGMKPSECCVNCKKWELEDYRTRLERRKRR